MSSAITYLRWVLPHFIFIYCFVLFFTASHVLSAVVVGLLLALLVYFRIPAVDRDVANKMLQAEKVSIIAHRGAAKDAPENTIGAIRKAKRNGADGIEFDLSYTSDGVPVLLHDDTVDRTTNGTGDIDKLTWSYVQTLNAAVNDSAKSGFDYEKVPTLDEAVQVCLNLGLRMYIDCKADAVRTAKVISDIYKKYPDLYKVALVCSFYPQVIYLIVMCTVGLAQYKLLPALPSLKIFYSDAIPHSEVRRADPRIVTALIHRPWFLTRTESGSWKAGRAWWELLLLTPIDILLSWAHTAFLWYLCGNAAYSSHKDACHKLLVSYFNQMGVKTVLWTVNDPTEKAYFTKALGCDIITDTLLNKTPMNT